MNIIDIVVFLMIGLGAVIGFKNGAIKQAALLIGFIVIIWLSFILKNPVANFFMDVFPFFDFKGAYVGALSLNILLYQFVAFFLVLSILTILFRVLVFSTGIVEKLLNMTIILGLVSKIIGAIIGALEAFVLVFIILTFLYTPQIRQIEIFENSKVMDRVVNHTPILSITVKDTRETFQEISDLQNVENADEFNKDAIDIMLRHKIIDKKDIKKLVDDGKIKIPNINSILNKY